MAGSFVASALDLGGSVTKYVFAWTADGSGNVNASTAALKRGRIYSLKLIPGSPAPSSGYSIRLLDPDGADLMNAAGASVNSSSPIYLTAAFDWFVEGFSAVTPTVAGAGAGAQGSLIVTIGP